MFASLRPILILLAVENVAIESRLFSRLNSRRLQAHMNML